MSTIAFFHKLFHLPDPTGDFLVRRILLGAHKEFSHVDSRLPITMPILHALCDSTGHVTQTSYHACLFRTIYLLMFHAFLRIGEVTSSRNNIKLSQLSVLSDTLIIVFQQAKHHFGSHISISIPSSQNAYCPVAALSLFTASSQNAYCPVAALSLFTASSLNAYCPVAVLSLFTASSQNAYCPVAALSLFTASSPNAYCPSGGALSVHCQLTERLLPSSGALSVHCQEGPQRRPFVL